jgi:nucleoside 2-deoxyribosyltransferase
LSLRHIAYVAGDYTAKTIEERNENIARADRVGRELLAKGYAVIVPHNMTRDWEFDERFTHDDFMESDLALLERAHIMVLSTPDWTRSKGTCIEVDFARENGITIYADVALVPDACDFMPDSISRCVARQYDRRRKGVATYGVPLNAYNGRDNLQDLLDELLDAGHYVMSEIEERGLTAGRGSNKI